MTTNWIDNFRDQLNQQPVIPSELFGPTGQELRTMLKLKQSPYYISGPAMALKIKKASEIKGLEFHSTGHATLDAVFKFPTKRMGVVYGTSQGGKTSTCMEYIASRQLEHQPGRDGKKDPGFRCLAILTETSDGMGDWWPSVGVDTARMDVIEPGDVPPMEELFDQLLGKNKMAAKKGDVDAHLERYQGSLIPNYDLILLDSADGLIARQQVLDSKNKHRGVAEDNPGVKARKWSEGLRLLCPALDHFNCEMVIICQTRSSIGGYGALEGVTGGNALKFYASYRLAIKRAGVIDVGTNDEKRIVGYNRRVVVEKTKVSGSELKEVILPYLFGKGVDSATSLFNACANTVIQVKGGWMYSEFFPGGKIQGRENVLAAIRNDKDLFTVLDQALRDYSKKIDRDVSVRDENEEESDFVPPPTIGDVEPGDEPI